jgi:hypothetical protein
MRSMTHTATQLISESMRTGRVVHYPKSARLLADMVSSTCHIECRPGRTVFWRECPELRVILWDGVNVDTANATVAASSAATLAAVQSRSARAPL